MKENKEEKSECEIGWFNALTTQWGYFLMFLVGNIRDFLAKFTGWTRYKGTKTTKGHGQLLKSWESFFTRRMYHRIQDCWNRPICSAPSARSIEVMERDSQNYNCTLQTTGRTTACLNLGSYNYLGFADDWNALCGEPVLKSVDQWPISLSSSRSTFGNISLHEKLEKTVAEFVGKEAAIVLTMGYGTNLTTIRTLMGPESLIISDSLNHTSIVNGARASEGSLIRVFKHNDTADLEGILREAIARGQPKHHRPWKKIMVIVEGIYSMEGEVSPLAEIVRLCKSYKVYLFVDEAHSIGALGKTGRGICEHTGVNPKDVDILMGTFTKSFGGMGGYISASKDIIDFIKSNSAGVQYHNSMSPIVCQQVLTAFDVLRGRDGTNVGATKLQSLKDNSNFFRSEMIRMGLHVYGDEDSPIIPVLIYHVGKVAAFSRECLKRGVAVVVVGFPATTLMLARARFCISAGHTREDLEYAVRVIDEVTSLLLMKYQRSLIGWAPPKTIDDAKEL